MAAIEVERQMLPMFQSPNQGARFYNPELPATEPFVPGHRTCAVDRRSVSDDEQGVGRQHHSGRPDRLHACGEQLVPLHPYNVPWAHTQIGSAGSFTAGVAAATKR